MASRTITVTMEDGSEVTLTARMTRADAVITERDQAAIREAIHTISAKRMDPQRADRRRRQERREDTLGDDFG